MDESFVEGKSIKLRTAGSDFSRTVDFEVYGSLPRSAGKHEVWVESEGGRVRIGYAMIALDRETLNVVMGRNDTRSASFRVINTWNYTISVSMVKQNYQLK